MVKDEWKKTDGRLAARCAAVTSVGAGIIHFAVAPVHWVNWIPAGLFFAAIAVAQLVWAYFAWTRPTVPVLGIGIAVNVGLVALWVSAHTSGPPLGPGAGHPEPVTAAGIAAQLLQCYVIMGAGWAWFRGYRAEQVSGFNRALVLLGTNAVMIGAVTVGLASIIVGHPHRHGDGVSQTQAEHQGKPMPEHPPAQFPAAPGPEQGLPVTDMGLDTSADETSPAPVPAADHRHGD